MSDNKKGKLAMVVAEKASSEAAFFFTLGLTEAGYRVVSSVTDPLKDENGKSFYILHSEKEGISVVYSLNTAFHDKTRMTEQQAEDAWKLSFLS